MDGPGGPQWDTPGTGCALPRAPGAFPVDSRDGDGPGPDTQDRLCPPRETRAAFPGSAGRGQGGGYARLRLRRFYARLRPPRPRLGPLTSARSAPAEVSRLPGASGAPAAARGPGEAAWRVKERSESAWAPAPASLHPHVPANIRWRGTAVSAISLEEGNARLVPGRAGRHLSR
jgi:hypothetical protein